ncbi:hypothetical protein PUH89_11470 [Rhodobacter capsulatus]|uniref:Uncharacterized protein n=1 Tax=Rhodobacter capsulatus TaxID=1061 RepID=A0A1G7JYJ7_RHOCA|nr:hypothetical protein [Rhodobacter capsulatus]WER07956.1 hypothetical protein PUH89_11470 [Rhodobacter capsulatus]SDF29932.1 hypothetical protein SAMN04244550_02007 [Rhodobacter capsulatus]
MVWTHTSSQPVAAAAVFGPWLGRVLVRLRTALSPAPSAPGWPAAVIAAADQPLGTAGIAPGIGLQRIGRAAAAAPARHRYATAPAIAPTAALRGFAPVPVAVAPAAARFYGLDEDAVSVVYVLSHRSGAGLSCLDWLADHGLPFRRIGALHPTAPVWSAPQGALLLVDLDTLGGISEMTEPLMRLRLGRPDIAVVLLSEEVETHDFGTERLVLADITLRLPCAFASFEFALVEAPINNAAWQERLLGDQR